MAYDSKGTLNKVMLIGRLGQDPEVKYTPSGAAVVTLSVATNTSYKDQDGKMQEQTEWNRVVAWRKTAENIGQYCKKGHRIYVEGKLTTRSWNDKDGNKRYTTEITADSVQFLEGKSDREPIPQEPPPHPSEADFSGPTPAEADDLPF
jgi:single-strand DNA-binding protein